MKPFLLLSLLAAALAANAQSGVSGASDSGAASDTGGASSIPSAPSSPADPSTPSSASSAPATSASDPSTPTTTPPPPTSTPPPQSPTVSASQVVSTNADGETVTSQVFITFTPSTSPSSSSSSAPDSNPTSSSSSGLGTGGIIGLAVAGGVALISLVGFLIWKFSSKRSSDFDDSENIKWPELNAHTSDGDSHAMPVRDTGRAGFDTGDEPSRAPSVANTYGGASSADLHSATDDPYAVPPLPHLNPNQPYRDDPNAMNAAGYYDPYHGPVPQTFNEAHGAPPPDWGGHTEAIPMTQMAQGQQAYANMGRTPSPGPQAAYGRVSPGPQAAYGRASPGPQAAYGAGPGMGRTPSPGPQAAYGGRASPGPQQAYGGGM